MKHRPSFEEVIQRFLDLGFIDEEAAGRYRNNYAYFEEHRIEIEQNYKGKWVAACEGKLYVSDTKDNLFKSLEIEPHSDRAYLKHVGYDP